MHDLINVAMRIILFPGGKLSLQTYACLTVNYGQCRTYDIHLLSVNYPDNVALFSHGVCTRELPTDVSRVFELLCMCEDG